MSLQEFMAVIVVPSAFTATHVDTFIAAVLLRAVNNIQASEGGEGGGHACLHCCCLPGRDATGSTMHAKGKWVAAVILSR